MFDLGFFKNKRVLVTGHTGFKGSWLCKALIFAGANVSGFSLEPITNPSLYELVNLKDQMTSIIGDIRNIADLRTAFFIVQPEIVLHLAAQPIVRDGYREPLLTYETNVMGTVNILECVRMNPCVKSFLNVTTDKVYQNREWIWGYREDEPLDGYDPYSNSKSCSELVSHCYKRSFFADGCCAISTARAGNVIGGGDFANNRIIPDCVRAVMADKPITVRNPHSIRPYQHVLEPIIAYLMIAQRQYEDQKSADWYNVGPDDCDCVTTGDLTEIFCRTWGNGARWENVEEPGTPHEANILKLDSAKLKNTFQWRSRWHIEDAVEKVVDWTKVWLKGGDLSAEMDKQIAAYLGDWS